jgi:hypothetical protein
MFPTSTSRPDITSTGWHEVAISSTSLGVIVAQVTTKALLKTV